MKAVGKIFLAGLFLAIMSICSVSQAHVLDGAKEWNGHYYKIFQMQMPWEQANKFCQSMGGHLATAETQAENEMLKDLVIKQKGGEYWIGGYCKDNIWRWITGKTITDYFDWANSPPSGDDRRIQMLGYREGKWDWSYNTYRKLFICEWESAANAHESNM